MPTDITIGSKGRLVIVDDGLRVQLRLLLEELFPEDTVRLNRGTVRVFLRNTQAVFETLPFIRTDSIKAALVPVRPFAKDVYGKTAPRELSRTEERLCHVALMSALKGHEHRALRASLQQLLGWEPQPDFTLDTMRYLEALRSGFIQEDHVMLDAFIVAFQFHVERMLSLVESSLTELGFQRLNVRVLTSTLGDLANAVGHHLSTPTGVIVFPDERFNSFAQVLSEYYAYHRDWCERMSLLTD